MPVPDYPYNLIRGLSDFWQRFFADADQLDSMYRGASVLIGQAYLDLMSAVLGVSFKDALVHDKEYYRLITIREDEVALSEGSSAPNDRWVFALPDPVVGFASLDNRVVEPTASLEPTRDYEIVDGNVRFKVDPTDAAGDGVPLAGYARRAVDVEVGGKFGDSSVTDWLATDVKKGDVLRLLDIGTDGTQRKRSDHPIVLVRADGLYVDDETPLPAPGAGMKYVVLRVPATPTVGAESFTLAANVATLAHTRIDVGSVRVYARGPGGADVVEGVDYAVNYEHGKIFALTAWIGIVAGAGTFAIDYTWRREVHPNAGASPRSSTTGIIVASTTTTRVLQIAAWAPDTLIDRRTLANNFGVLIGREQPSSETYRAFIAGIFQLYVLGPVLERIESALNVVLNLPVVRDDGEVFQSIDTSDPLVDRVLTTRPTNGLTATYDFPKGTPFRSDLVAGLALESFDPLTTAVDVTDYVQSPHWWHGAVIPEDLFSAVNGERPDISRRTASAQYVRNVVGAPDAPVVGDPGLMVGADEDGFPSQFRHRMAFVLMDRYLKYHTFSVRFSTAALSAALGPNFAQSIRDLNELVLSARPSHTFVFTTPTTDFRDEIEVSDVLSFARQIGSGVFGPDKVVFADMVPTVGAGVWTFGDYFKYELWTANTAFPAIGVPVALANAPAGPRRRYLVRVFVDGMIGGRRLVENLDYSVNYATGEVTRLTAWTSTTVDVVYRQLNIGNVADAPIGADDMPLLVNGVDPAIIVAVYDASAAGWDGVATPPSAPRDMSMVERALIVHAHP